jgi:hypothetical protein
VLFSPTTACREGLPLLGRRASVCWTLLVMGMALFFAACGAVPPVKSTSARHVVVIVIDTLRADHLPTFGYAKDTAPFLNKLAGSSTVFTHAVSTSSFTGEAISSLFTGRYPSASSWGGGWYARPTPDKTTLATAFREAGYETALFSNSPVLDAPEFYRGFGTTYCFTEFGVSGQGPRLIEKAVSWFKEHQDESTFTYLHFLDPHSPYTPPDAYYRRFGDTRPDAPLGLYEDVREQVPALQAAGFAPGEARYEDLVARYDGEIAFIDDTLKSLFDRLDGLEILKETLVVVTADHGEEFLEHDFVEHAWTLYPEVHRIPLLFWQPGHLPAERLDQTVSLVDIMPTLFQLQGLPGVPGGSGASLFQQVPDDRWMAAPIPGPRVMELLIQSRSLVRGVVTDDTLYLAYWKWLSPEACAQAAITIRATRAALLDGTQAPVDSWGAIVREEFYDLSVDPDAVHNVAADNPEAVARWRAYLRDYERTCPPQLSDRFKATRDQRLLTEEERKTLGDVPAAFLQPTAPDTTHDHALETLGYL